MTVVAVCARRPPWLLAVVLISAAAGLRLGLFFDEGQHTRGRLIISNGLGGDEQHHFVLQRLQQTQYRILGPTVWPRTVWGNCSSYSEGQKVQSSQAMLCQLPSIWRDCSQGIYIDVGTNVGAQLRKLYDPWQFPLAQVLGLFNSTYGHNRSRVCALGIEANPVHTPYLQKLNAYFRSRGYQAIVLTETAASIKPGKATFHLDHGSPVEWGASLSQGSWQGKSTNTSNTADVSLFDLPAFLADIVRPLVREHDYRPVTMTKQRPPVGMKLDVEGEEYALLPALVTSGALCDLSMAYIELHPPTMKTPDGMLAGMNATDVEDVFAKMRRANPRCNVNYSHLDDESYLHADTEVPLPSSV